MTFANWHSHYSAYREGQSDLLNTHNIARLIFVADDFASMVEFVMKKIDTNLIIYLIFYLFLICTEAAHGIWSFCQVFKELYCSSIAI